MELIERIQKLKDFLYKKHILESPSRDISKVKEDLESIVSKIKNNTINSINEVIFDIIKIKYDENYIFLDELLKYRKGDCISLSCLYYIILDYFKFDVELVSLRSHVFVRVNNKNIEATSKGMLVENKFYAKQFDIPLSELNKYIKPVLASYGLEVILLNKIGSFLYIEKKLKEAEYLYNEAINLNKSFPQPFFNRGNLYFYLGKFSQAEKDYKRSLYIDPLFLQPYINLGILLYLQNRKKEFFSLIKGNVYVEEKLNEFLSKYK